MSHGPLAAVCGRSASPTPSNHRYVCSCWFLPQGHGLYVNTGRAKCLSKNEPRTFCHLKQNTIQVHQKLPRCTADNNKALPFQFFKIDFITIGNRSSFISWYFWWHEPYLPGFKSSFRSFLLYTLVVTCSTKWYLIFPSRQKGWSLSSSYVLNTGSVTTFQYGASAFNTHQT